MAPPGNLQSVLPTLLVANADGVVDRGQENLPITDFTGFGSLQDGVHGSIHQMVGQDHFEFDLGQQVYRILAPAIDLCVPLLPAVAAHIADRHTFHANLKQSFLNRSEEHTSELQSPCNLVCRLLLEKKKTTTSHSSAPASTIRSGTRSTPRRSRRSPEHPARPSRIFS